MKKIIRFVISKKRWLIYPLIALSVGVLYYLAREVEWSVLRKISAPVLGITILIALLYMLVNTLSTWLVLRGMGYSTPFHRLFLVITSCLSTNYMTPVKAGIPIRLWLYKAMMKIPVAVGSATMVIETTLGWVIGTMLSLLGAQLILRQTDMWPYVTALSIFTTSFIILLLIYPQIFGSVVRKGFPSEYATRIINWGHRFLESIRTVPLWTATSVVILYFLRLSARAFCLHVILKDMGILSSVIDLVFIQSISGIVGIMSLLPMGLGAKDISLNVLMIQIGIPREIALVGVLIDRLLWTMIPLVVGLVSANVIGISHLKDNTDRFGTTQEEAIRD